MVPRPPLPPTLLLPRGRAIDPPRTHENIPSRRRSTLPTSESNSEYDRKSHLPASPLPSSARPPIIASVIDWIIKVLITHPSSSAPRLPRHTLRSPYLSLVTIPLCVRVCVGMCVCVPRHGKLFAPTKHEFQP